MDKTSIIVGDEYAIREPVAKGVDFQRVKILANVRGSQWRAEWIEPNRGLIEYVQSRNVIVEWSQRKAFLRDEVREAELADHLSRRGHRRDEHPVAWAVTTVLETTGEQTSLILSMAKLMSSLVAIGSPRWWPTKVLGVRPPFGWCGG